MKTKTAIMLSLFAFSVGFAQQKNMAKEARIYTTAKNQTEKFSGTAALSP
jgi:hypothetical protein